MRTSNPAASPIYPDRDLEARCEQNGQPCVATREPAEERDGLELDQLTEFHDARVLLRKWKAARTLNSLPLYEDLVLGSLGKLADEIAVVRNIGNEEPVIVRAGNKFENVVQRNCNLTPLSSLPVNYQFSISTALDCARSTGSPGLRLCQSTVEGMISTVELVALPLASHWEGEFFLLFARPREKQVDLASLLINSTNEGIMALSCLEERNGQPLDFMILSINDGAAKLLGSTVEKLRSSRLSEALTRAGFRRGLRALRAALRTGDHSSFTFEYTAEKHKVSIKAGISRAGELLTVTLIDVGELRAREALFRSMFDANPVPMVVVAQQDARILRVNDAALRLYGYGRDDFMQLSLRDLRLRELGGGEDDGDGDVQAGGSCWTHEAACGTVLNVVEYERDITVEGVPATLATIVDMTERARAEAQITFLAHHDPLTRLPNRTVFTEALERSFSDFERGATAFSVLTIDLDGFKLINDTQGHDAGDMVLTEVARRLVELAGAEDTVARLGGDEFAMILSGCSTREACLERATHILKALDLPHDLNGRLANIEASIGIAVVPGEAKVPEQALKFSDLALYRAKKDTGSAVRVFEPEMDRVESERRSLEVELRRAVIEREFELHYQPIMSVKTGRLRGFEALIRWRHPSRGLVPPADFIPLAEEAGLIEQMGEWVLFEACRQAVDWPGHLIVAVNVSARQFGSDRLVGTVRNALDESGLAAERLEVEITESVLLNDTQDNIEVLQQLRALNARIALDDFGTGYSSMGYLAKFPFNRIKIDRSFVRDIGDNKSSQAVIRAIVSLGSSLGMDITAEGVENADQLEVLISENCSDLQGYLFSPPIPRQDLHRVIEAYCGPEDTVCEDKDKVA
ncbi:putative bifunctional diguanylate cyclase/phosphodiesterase [Hoeflea prorocentri]|uniref:EAL domain-containing protein n=1 Tax=Hoeflea prorocentri TaxID=1922333 RepID=A0A9X3UJ76_9HYPH|nr:EAL domain-containing protein [Hoeflea prorocentri]MCY6382352.1 EAL domain-containing protein [Hoeflea prorocentri]MDA5400152.1 EAL domain-containing protein [Hoeflea prorocentri]